MSMLKTIDKYIIKKYLFTFTFVMMAFALITIIVDFTEKVEELIASQLSVREIITQYYIPFALWINPLLFHLYALITVIFFTSRMAYNSEIIAMLSAGISLRRILRPYLLAAGFLAGLLFVGNHYLIPRTNSTRINFEYTYIWKSEDHGKVKNVNLFLKPDVKAYVRYFRKRDSTALDLRIEKIEGNQITSILKAKSAKWIGPPRRWRLLNYEIRTFDGARETWFREEKEPLDTALGLRLSDFVYFQNQKDAMTSPEIRAFIPREHRRGLINTLPYEIELARRTADPFTLIILTIIGFALASRKVRGGMGLHLAMGIGLGAALIFLSRFSATFAANEAMPVWLGIWLPNIIFGIVAIIVFRKAQR